MSLGTGAAAGLWGLHWGHCHFPVGFRGCPVPGCCLMGCRGGVGRDLKALGNTWKGRGCSAVRHSCLTKVDFVLCGALCAPLVFLCHLPSLVGPAFHSRDFVRGGTLMGCGTVTEVCLIQETGQRESVPGWLPPAAQARCST